MEETEEVLSEATETKTEEAKPETMFSKEQLLKATKYEDMQDLINALLQDDKEYSLSSVDGLIQDFMKGKVK